MAFTEEFTKLRTTHRHCVDIFYIEFHPNIYDNTERYSTLQYSGTVTESILRAWGLLEFFKNNILFILLSAVSYLDRLLSPLSLHSRFALSSLAQHATQ